MVAWPIHATLGNGLLKGPGTFWSCILLSERDWHRQKTLASPPSEKVEVLYTGAPASVETEVQNFLELRFFFAFFKGKKASTTTQKAVWKMGVEFIYRNRQNSLKCWNLPQSLLDIFLYSYKHIIGIKNTPK